MYKYATYIYVRYSCINMPLIYICVLLMYKYATYIYVCYLCISMPLIYMCATYV